MNCWHLQFGVEGNIGGDLGFLLNCGGAVAAWLVRSSPHQVVHRFLSRRQHCIVFLSKTLYSHSASLFPGALMGTGELNAG